MLLIQIVAAALLLLGSGLIFKALAEIDAPSPPPPSVRLDGPAPSGPTSYRRRRPRLPRPPTSPPTAPASAGGRPC